MEINYQTIAEANRLYHDAHAEKYDEVTMKGNFHRVERVLKRYRGEDKIFLDMGCGTGEILKIAKKHFGAIYGIDISEKMAELAKEVTPNIMVGDVSNVPLEPGHVDFINCYSVLHHLYHPEPLILEAARLLRPGGIFYSDNDPNRGFYRLFKWWLLFRRKFIRTKDKFLSDEEKHLEKLAEYHQKNGINPDLISLLLYKAGFSKWKIEYHYPEKPDTFTKILILLNKIFNFKSFHYYFSVTAIK